MLSSLFLEHVIFVFSQPPILRGDSRKGENSSRLVDGQMEDDVLQAAIFALTAFFRSVQLDAFIKSLLYYTVEQILQCFMLLQRWW